MTCRWKPAGTAWDLEISTEMVAGILWGKTVGFRPRKIVAMVEWVWFAEFNLERASIPMIVADVDDDGDRDIVWCSAHGFGVYWLEQSRATDGQRIWQRHAIDTSWSQGHAPLWVDMDQDGRNELIIGKRYMAHGGADPGEYDPIAIYRYEFNPNQRTWDRWLVSPFEWRVGVGLDPKVGDLDGDGDLDYMASGRSGLYWLENLGPPKPPVQSSSAPLPEYDDHQNLLVVGASDGTLNPVEDPEAWGVRRWRQHLRHRKSTWSVTNAVRS